MSLLFSLSSVLSLMITRKQLSFLVTYDLFGSGSRGEDGSFSEFVIIITQKIFFSRGGVGGGNGMSGSGSLLDHGFFRVD